MPDIGLIFWQVVVFLVLVAVLSRFAWGPITRSLHAREDFIADSLKRAEEARILLDKTKQERRIMLQKAREEREASMEETRTMIARMQREAREEARRLGDEMIRSAELSIKKQKEEAVKEVRDHVVTLAIQVSEKILRNRLRSEEAQKDLLIRYLDGVSDN